MKLITKFYYAVTKRLQQEPSYDFVNEILEERPDLKGKNFHFPPQGTLSYTVIIEDEFFKKPTNHHNFLAPIFNKDAKNILKFKDADFDALPKIKYISRDKSFYSTTRTAGVMLKDLLPQLTEKEEERLAEDIAKAIIVIAHNMPTNNRNHHIRHGDIKPENILIDPKSKRFTGLIDYGRMIYRPKDKLGKLGLLFKWHYGDSKLPEMINQKYKELSKEQNSPNNRTMLSPMSIARA